MKNKKYLSKSIHYSFLIKNNQGDITTEEILKLVLAIAGLAILLMLGFSLYKIFVQKTDIEQAREHLSTMQGVIANLPEGQSTTYLLTGPKNWYLVSYRNAEIKTHPALNIPRTCAGKDCICICQYDPHATRLEDISIDQYMSLSYFYYFFYYSLTDKITTDNSISIDGLPYRGEGLDYCQSNGACVNVNNVRIDYAQSFDVVTSRTWGDFLNFQSSQGVKGIFVPWASINDTSIDLSISKMSGGEVIIENKNILKSKVKITTTTGK